MKKLVAISILLALLTVTAFAQFKVGFSADFYPSLLRASAPVGDGSDAKAKEGKYYWGKGTFDFFTTDDIHGQELRLALSYTDPEKNYGGLLQLKADDWINRKSNGTVNKYGGGGASLTAPTSGSNTPALVDIFNAAVGDWNVWGKIGNFSAMVGNTENTLGTRAVQLWDAASIDYLLTNRKLDQYGILRPIAPSYTTLNAGYDIDDNPNRFRTLALNRSAEGGGGLPHVEVAANFAPISVTLSGHMGNAFSISNSTAYNSGGFGLRVSAAKISFLDFDVVYKMSGNDPTVENADNTETKTGDGKWNHSFGLFATANLPMVPGLGVGLGYSGAFQVQEDEVISDVTVKYKRPYYNGIDLRVNFGGVENLNVTFNNNISFAYVKGEDDDNTVVYGLKRTSPANITADSKRSEGYITLYNALAAKYWISADTLFATFELSNTLSHFTDTQDTGGKKNRPSKLVETEVVDLFRAGIGAGYKLKSNVELGTGLVFDVTNNSHTETDGGNTNSNWDSGLFTFAIPVHFKVSF